LRAQCEIRHTWSSELRYEPTDPGQDPRQVGTLEPLWNIFDLTPKGDPNTGMSRCSFRAAIGPVSNEGVAAALPRL
jgi:predicted dithiol-disulfide oxidoreductase (DUF899 family)